MKKIKSVLVLMFFLLNMSLGNFAHGYDENDESSVEKIETENFFVVTAYYSPIPGQKYYLRGNYEDEVILNGKGIRGASGKEVFPGMLAAPKTYSFGTKIYLEGVGIGEVADRGGAIVTAGNRGYSYDRIDIWMGVGDEGLKRALAWGKRVVPGYILPDSNTTPTIYLNNFPAPDSAVKGLSNKGEYSYNNEILNLSVTPESGIASIMRLQQIMNKLGILDQNKITGKYEDSKNELITYQIENGIISSKDSPEAGYFGPKTRKKMSEDMEGVDVQKEIERKLAIIKKHATTKVDFLMKYIGNVKSGDKNNKVKILQQILIMFKSSNSLKATGVYGDKTEIALKRYQLARGVINSFDDEGAGVYGPKTKAQLRADLIMLYEKKLIKFYKLGGN